MPFQTQNDAIQRLTDDPTPLSDAEMRDLYRFLQALPTGAIHRLNMELALRTGQAIARFDKNSGKTAMVSLVLNFAMLILSGLAIFIAVKSYHQAEHSAVEQQATLDASRTALQQVLATATEQEKLLQQSVEMARQQLLVIRGQRSRKRLPSSR